MDEHTADPSTPSDVIMSDDIVAPKESIKEENPDSLGQSGNYALDIEAEKDASSIHEVSAPHTSESGEEEGVRVSRRVTRSSTQPSQLDIATKRYNQKMMVLDAMNEINEEFENVREMFFITKEKELQKEYNKVIEGNHPELKKQLDECDEDEKKQVADLNTWFQLRFDNLRSEYESEVKRIREEFEASRGTKRQKYLDDIAKKKKSMESDDEEYALTEDGMHTEVSRLKRSLRKRGNSGEPSHTRRKMVSTNLLFTLTDEEIQADLVSIGIENVNKNGRVKTRSKF